jgi:hypothetical protein
LVARASPLTPPGGFAFLKTFVMYIICSKRNENTKPTCVVMKTPHGALPIAFVAEQDARAYVTATGLAAHLEVHSRESLLNSAPAALEGVSHLLLIPSLDEVRSLLRDAASFPYDRFVVAITDVA